MFKTILLTVLLLFGFTTPASGGWQIVLQDTLQEPNQSIYRAWAPEVLPEELFAIHLLLVL